MLEITAETAAMMDLMRSLEPFGARLPNAQANVLNRVGTKVRSAVIPAMTKQTGLSKRIITKAVKMSRASPQNPRVVLSARGGDLSLRYFGAHEVSGGAEATVRGTKLFVAGGFRRSGAKGQRRIVLKNNPQVYVNVDGKRWRGHIQAVKSGVFIPAEMISGETAKAFDRIVETDLLMEVERELTKLLPGGKV